MALFIAGSPPGSASLCLCPAALRLAPASQPQCCISSPGMLLRNRRVLLMLPQSLVLHPVWSYTPQDRMVIARMVECED